MRRPVSCALAWGFIAALAFAPAAQALPFHLPGHRRKAVVAPNEGRWFVKAGEAADIYANTGKKPLSMQAYVCTRPEGPNAPRVELEVLGRAPIEIQGCQSLYLLLTSGERLAVDNPTAADVTGTYKLDLQPKGP